MKDVQTTIFRKIGINIREILGSQWLLSSGTYKNCSRKQVQAKTEP